MKKYPQLDKLEAYQSSKVSLYELEELALDALIEADEDDTEMAHMGADEVLCALLTKLGYKHVVDRYEAIEKWFA